MKRDDIVRTYICLYLILLPTKSSAIAFPSTFLIFLYITRLFLSSYLACEKNKKCWHSHFWKPFHNLGLIYLYGDKEGLTDYKKAEQKFTEAKDVNRFLKDVQELHPIHSGLALTYLFQALAIKDAFRYLQKIKTLRPKLIKRKKQRESKQQERQKQIKRRYLQITKYRVLKYSFINVFLVCNLLQNIFFYLIFNNCLNFLIKEKDDIDNDIKIILKNASNEINKAADIALDKEADIYWNIGLIILAQIHKAEVKIDPKKVYNAWEKALKIAYNAKNKSDDLWIVIYNYAISSLKETDFAYKFYLSKYIAPHLHCVKTGWLKVMLKDVRTISKILDKQNESIKALIKILEETIEKKDKQEN